MGQIGEIEQWERSFKAHCERVQNFRALGKPLIESATMSDYISWFNAQESSQNSSAVVMVQERITSEVIHEKR